MAVGNLPYPVLLLVTALAHSLWQGPLIAGLTAVLLRRTRFPAPDLRYRLLLIALATAILLPLLTAWTAHDSMFSEVVAGEARRRGLAAEVSARRLGIGSVTLAVASIWLAGVLVALVGFGLGAIRLHRTIGRARPSRRARAFVNRSALAVERVDVRESAEVTSPCLAGLRRPVILLPPDIFDRLAPDELRSVLRHELAHVARGDFAVNLAQRLVECVGWFNPAIWHLSRSIRRVREECCDRDSARSTRDSLLLARALLRLEETRFQALSLGLTSPAGELAIRVASLLEPPNVDPSGPLGRGLPLAFLGAAALIAGSIAAGRGAGALIRQAMPIHRIEAIDPAGPFDVALLGGRILTTSFERQGSRVIQRGRDARIVDRGGSTVLALRMEINGFHWAARSRP